MFRPSRASCRRGGALIAAGLAAALALTACGGQNSSDAPRSQTVVYAYSGNLSSVDPVHADFSETASVDQALYDTLVGYTKDGEMVPQLATSYQYADDMLSIDMTLRGDVTFHDGTKFTAKDVAYTLDRIGRLNVGVASSIKNYKSTEVIDDTHLKINLDKGDALLLGALSNIYILNSALVAKNAANDDGQAWLNKNDAGSGPYTLANTSGTQTTTNIYAKYWDFSGQRPATFAFRQVDQTSTLTSEIKAGNIDIGKITTKDGDQLQDQVDKGALKFNKAKDGAQVYIYFNTSKGPTANIAVRKAITLAYDYENAITQVRGGMAELATGVLPSSVSCRPDLPSPKQDLDAAKKVLDDAGITNLKLTLGYQPNRSVNLQEATLLQSDLKKIGVTLDLSPMQFPEYLTTLANFSTIPEMFLAADAPPYPGAGTLLSQLYLSTSVGTNRAAYSNAKFDQLVNQANATPDEDARCDLYKQAQQILATDIPAANLYMSEDLWAYRSDLGDTVYLNPVHGTLAVKAVRLNS